MEDSDAGVGNPDFPLFVYRKFLPFLTIPVRNPGKTGVTGNTRLQPRSSSTSPRAMAATAPTQEPMPPKRLLRMRVSWPLSDTM